MRKSIFLIIAIFLLIISDIFLFFQNQNLKKDITVLNKKIEELEKELEKLQITNNDWQTYKNEIGILNNKIAALEKQ